MDLEGNDQEIPSGEIAKIASAVAQMAGQLRQIKILVLIFGVASLSISVGSSVYFATRSLLPDEYDDEPRVTEAGAADNDTDSAGPSENDPLPSIHITDADGRVWSNRDLDGKAVLLNFWTTWCAPCRHEMPIFDEMQEKYESEGFQVLAVSWDREGWGVVRPYIAEQKFSYPIFIADESIERGFGRITTFPTTYFMRRDGTIATKHVGGLSRSRLVRHVESLLAVKSGTSTDAPGAKSSRPGDDTGLPARAAEARVRDVDEFSPPKMVGFVAPRFTKELLDSDMDGGAGMKGSVELELQVEADGSLQSIKVVSGLSPEMDKRVVEAVKQARFEPAKKAGKPVPMQMRMNVKLGVNRVVKPYDPDK